VIPLGLAVIMVFCALGGCWWPMYQMPPWLRQLAQLTFTAWAMEGLHDVILRDRGLIDVLPALGVLFAYGAVCLAGGARFQRLDSV
jgi:ABC-2 type transport system permease protein